MKTTIDFYLKYCRKVLVPDAKIKYLTDTLIGYDLAIALCDLYDEYNQKSMKMYESETELPLDNFLN